MPTPNRTPQDAADPRPLHERIATELRRQIFDRTLKPGDDLPSTEKLKARFGASNASIQKAVALLKQAGLVEGRPGASISVLPFRRHTLVPAASSKPAEADRPYRWITEAQARGKAPKITILNVVETEPPTDVAEALGLEEGGTALLRKQLLSLDDEPCEVVCNYYPVELAQGTAMMGRARIKGGTPTLLAELGYPPLHTVDLVTAEEATTEEYELLRLPRQIPVLRTLRVVLSHDDRPIEVTTMVKAGHLYGLQYDF